MIMIAVFAALAVLSPSAAEVEADFTRPGKNVALGRSYRLSPQPNYSYCTDAGDAKQLTDGKYATGSSGCFWTRKSTVGWSGVPSAVVVIDLGSAVPIGGISFNTAARDAAGVHWPLAVFVYVSDDGQRWWRAGELLALSAGHGLPPEASDAKGSVGVVHRYWTDELRCQGRYVGLAAFARGGNIFCDEIEVYRGPADAQLKRRQGEPITDLRQQPKSGLLPVVVRQMITADLGQVRRALAESGLADEPRRQIETELAEAWDGETPALPPDFVPKCPLTPGHAKVLSGRGAMWQAQGRPELTLWQNGRCEPGANSIWWSVPKNRESADTVRLEVLRVIEELGRATNANIKQSSSRPTGGRLLARRKAP